MDLLQIGEREMRSTAWQQLSMIFQEPMTSLNPVFTDRRADRRSVRLHKGLDRKSATAHALRMLGLVEIPAAAQRIHEYPHQLVGRHAPARDDRAGHGLRPDAADRRRADYRAAT